MKVKALRAFVLGPGKVAEIGDVIDVDKNFALFLFRTRKAEPYTKPDELAVPKDETRKAVTRKTRPRGRPRRKK